MALYINMSRTHNRRICGLSRFHCTALTSCELAWTTLCIGPAAPTRKNQLTTAVTGRRLVGIGSVWGVRWSQAWNGRRTTCQSWHNSSCILYEVCEVIRVRLWLIGSSTNLRLLKTRSNPMLRFFCFLYAILAYQSWPTIRAFRNEAEANETQPAFTGPEVGSMIMSLPIG